MGESSTAQETRTDGSPFWIDDDLAKVKGPERGGNIRCVGKFPAAKKRRVQDPQIPLLKAEVKGLRKDFMSMVAVVKEHIPGLNLSTLISRANTNMEGDDACNVPDNSLAHNPKNPRSVGASHHPKNSTSTPASAHLKNSRSTATSPHPKNPTSGTRPKNPTSGPSRQCYSYYRTQVVMSADSAVTYTSVHSEARSWSIPSEDPYEEAAQQLLEQAPPSPEYIPDPMELEDHVPVYIPEPEHPEDLVPAEDEAPTPLLPPFFLSPRIRPLSPRALEVEMRDVASAFYHSLHP
ncbi:hypothetical protein Tco_0378821 [Tanacetum coccineum]